MKLSQIKTHLISAETLDFKLENGTSVPKHFHITEIGVVTKHFIDCGGTVRNEKTANFQLWNANDTEHRLKPEKLLGIITLSEKLLGIEDLEIEVEYQTETIGKYSLEYDGENFLLMSTHTDCLAKENCQSPKQTVIIAEKTFCPPNSNCC